MAAKRSPSERPSLARVWRAAVDGPACTSQPYRAPLAEPASPERERRQKLSRPTELRLRLLALLRLSERCGLRWGPVPQRSSLPLSSHHIACCVRARPAAHGARHTRHAAPRRARTLILAKSAGQRSGCAASSTPQSVLTTRSSIASAGSMRALCAEADALK